MALSDHLFSTLSGDKWRAAGVKKRSGVLVPLFSVYSSQSAGIGDLADLKLLIDWAAATGNSILQLLPMNETGSLNCPYDALSSFALEPAYLSLKNIGVKIKKKFSAPKGHVDYIVKKQKIEILRDFFTEQAGCQDAGFKKFQEENNYWLGDFALYKVLKDSRQGKPWYEWEDKYKQRDKATLKTFSLQHEKEIAFQLWLQWQLFKQFKEARVYANKKKVLLNGDLPILVSRDSADVWMHPEFFKLEFAAGAPPDMYCAKGQRWGMPTYNRENIARDDYRYIKEKLKFAQNFYDILRIDHAVGLFRIWSIPYQEPLERQGLNGFFDPADESLWQANGRQILSTMVESTSMLLCAEDLGIIPASCPKALWELGIPGNDVQRWVKDWNIRHDFLGPEEYRLLSVAMLSTHDTTNWAAWWENEAGTVDEDLFRRKCRDHRQIDYDTVREKLFDLKRSCHGRLRWQESVDSVDKLVLILGRQREELADFIDLYENTYAEKEKLWRHLGFSGKIREKADAKIIQAALKITRESGAIFSVNSIIDLLMAKGLFKGGPYQYRINTPGTISNRNWSLTLPCSLEELKSSVKRGRFYF